MKRSLLLLVGCFVAGVISVSAQDTQPDSKLTFEEAVKIGLERNVLLNQQRNFLVSSQANKLNAVGAFAPSLNFQARWATQGGQQPNATSGDLENITSDRLDAGFNANLTIFNGLRNLNFMAQANNAVWAQSYLIKRGAQDAVALIGTQYLQVLLDQELLKIAEENLKAQQVLLEQIKGFYEVGSRAITDLYNQDALTKGAEVSVVRARNTLINDKSLLMQTLQLDGSVDFEVVYPPLDTDILRYKDLPVDSLIGIAAANRADIKQSVHQVAANKYAMRVSSSNFLPSVTAFASYGSFYTSFYQDAFSYQFRTLNPGYSYGANLNIPIFSRFNSRAQYVNSKILYENSLLTKQNVEKTVRVDVQRSRSNLINAIEAYNSSLSQFQAGEQALAAQRESYELGVTAQVALAQATQTYVLGAASKAQAEVTLLFQKLQLEYALGTLLPESYSAK